MLGQDQLNTGIEGHEVFEVASSPYENELRLTFAEEFDSYKRLFKLFNYYLSQTDHTSENSTTVGLLNYILIKNNESHVPMTDERIQYLLGHSCVTIIISKPSGQELSIRDIYNIVRKYNPDDLVELFEN